MIPSKPKLGLNTRPLAMERMRTRMESHIRRALAGLDLHGDTDYYLAETEETVREVAALHCPSADDWGEMYPLACLVAQRIEDDQPTRKEDT